MKRATQVGLGVQFQNIECFLIIKYYPYQSNSSDVMVWYQIRLLLAAHEVGGVLKSLTPSNATRENFRVQSKWNNREP